jgi:hypothetical protein
MVFQKESEFLMNFLTAMLNDTNEGTIIEILRVTKHVGYSKKPGRTLIHSLDVEAKMSSGEDYIISLHFLKSLPTKKRVLLHQQYCLRSTANIQPDSSRAEKMFRKALVIVVVELEIKNSVPDFKQIVELRYIDQPNNIESDFLQIYSIDLGKFGVMYDI